jgi:DNA-binding transcriptional ArsR family regulator
MRTPSSRRDALSTAAIATAPAFAALGDATRLRIVLRLSQEGPLSISRLTGDTRITRQAVTKHLRSLEQARLVSSARRGRERLWQLRQSRLRDVRGYLDQISGQWDAAIERLRVLVEDN